MSPAPIEANDKEWNDKKQLGIVAANCIHAQWRTYIVNDSLKEVTEQPGDIVDLYMQYASRHYVTWTMGCLIVTGSASETVKQRSGGT